MTNLFENVPRKTTTTKTKTQDNEDDMFEDTIKQGTQEIVKITKKPKTVKPTIIQDNDKEMIIPLTEEAKKFEIQSVNQYKNLPNLEQKKLKIRQDINLIKFMVDSILDKDQDYFKGHIRRSGCCKLALAFDISYEVLSIDLEKEYDNNGNLKDIHAHAKAKAIRPNGSYVIAAGDKSKSEFWSEKKQSWGSYNLHNLRQTAATKACNRAILNAIPFGMISADEISSQDNDFDF